MRTTTSTSQLCSLRLTRDESERSGATHYTAMRPHIPTNIFFFLFSSRLHIRILVYFVCSVLWCVAMNILCVFVCTFNTRQNENCITIIMRNMQRRKTEASDEPERERERTKKIGSGLSSAATAAESQT